MVLKMAVKSKAAGSSTSTKKVKKAEVVAPKEVDTSSGMWSKPMLIPAPKEMVMRMAEQALAFKLERPLQPLPDLSQQLRDAEVRQDKIRDISLALCGDFCVSFFPNRLSTSMPHLTGGEEQSATW